jgi:hypothetical protein
VKKGPNCHKRVTIVNHTEERIYVGYGDNAEQELSSIPERYRIEPGESNDTAIRTKNCLEKQSGIIPIFIYPGSVIDSLLENSVSWHNWHRRYIEILPFITLEELQQMDFTIHYYAKEYPVLVERTEGGDVEVFNDGISVDKAIKGDTITISAIPDKNYCFHNWNCNPDILSDKDSATTTFIMPDYEVWIRAYFERNELPISVYPSLEGDAEASIDGVTAYGAVEGDVVTLTATPYEIYKFKEWSGNVPFLDHESSTTTFTMPNYGVEVWAEFSEK